MGVGDGDGVLMRVFTAKLADLKEGGSFPIFLFTSSFC